MKRQTQLGIAAGFLCFHFLFSGCVLFLVGAGAAGGYAVSKDTIEGLIEKRFDSVWSASREVLMNEGFIRHEDRARSEIEAEVRGSVVTIRVNQATDRTIRIQVKARKGHKLLPNANLANELYNKIFLKLK